MKQIGKREDVFLPVRKIEMSEIAPNFLTNSYNSHAIVVTMKDGQEIVVNHCSESYGLVPCIDLFDPLESELRKHLDVTPHYSHIGYAKFYVDYEINNRHFNVATDSKSKDVIKPVMRILHSYNSQLTYQLVFGFMRLICANGLWGIKYVKQIKLKHTTGNIAKIVEQTVKSVELFLEGAEELVTKFELLNQNIVPDVTLMVTEIAEKIDFPKKQIEFVISRIYKESEENDLPITDWLVYNAFNYRINYALNNMHEENKVRLDQKLFHAIEEYHKTSKY